MNNLILQTIEDLMGLLIGLSFIAMAAIQYLKTEWGIIDKTAKILSLVVGFLFAALTAWGYAWQFGYALVVPQWIGVGMFVLLGTIAPSGGYKLLYNGK